jgi:hypothetical protein
MGGYEVGAGQNLSEIGIKQPLRKTTSTSENRQKTLKYLNVSQNSSVLIDL